MLAGFDCLVRHFIARRQWRQQAAVGFLGRCVFLAFFDVTEAVVAAFLVDFQEAVELHD